MERVNVTLSPNLVTCPNCEKQFVHNQVNGIALLQLISDIDARKRMYARLALDDLEDLSDRGELTFGAVKKILLDSLNDFTRTIDTQLGFGTEAE